MLGYPSVKVLGPFNSHAKIHHLVPTFNRLTHNSKLSVTLENKDQSFEVNVFQNTIYIRITQTAY